MTNDNVRIAGTALCAAVIHVTFSGLMKHRMKRDSHVSACHEQIDILVDALQRAEKQSQYLMDIINKHEIGTEFDNIVINSLEDLM
jgi:hypothetical protein